MPITLPKPRYTIEDTGDKLRIMIPSKMSGAAIYLGSIMLLALILIAFSALRSGSFLLSFNDTGLFNLVAVIVWLSGLGWAILVLLWTFIGIEMVEIDSRTLIIRQHRPNLGRVREYDGDLIYHLHSVSPIVYRGRQGLEVILGLVGGPIAFEYSSETVRFGAGLTESEARMLVDIIIRRFPHYGL